MGKLGIGTFLPNETFLKKRYRFTFTAEAENGFTKIPPVCVQIAARPQLTIEKNEVFFGNERAFVAAKGLWEPINVTFYDFAIASDDGSMKRVHEWVKACYWFDAPADSGDMGDAAQTYKRKVKIRMHDGHGTDLEEWTLWGSFIESMNGGDLDYSSTDLAMLECTISYDNVQCVTKGGTNRKAQKEGGTLANFS